jgi:hypothetical protein
MTTKEFVRTLAAAVEYGYEFLLAEGVNLGPDKEQLPKWALRCDEIPGEQLQWGSSPIVAVCHYADHGMCDEAEACRRLGLSQAQRGMIIRAGEQIVCYNLDTGKVRVKYSVKLRRDMLAACGIEERCKAKILFK